MEKVIYLVSEENDSFETELIEEARYAHEKGATVLEIREADWFVGRVHVEVSISFQW